MRKHRGKKFTNEIQQYRDCVEIQIIESIIARYHSMHIIYRYPYILRVSTETFL